MARKAKPGRTIVIGLTGGIAAGKSTVAKLLAAQGARVIDADSIGRQELRKGSESFRDIVAAFGPQILGADGDIDRRTLAGLVFFHKDKLQVLNSITHPRINSTIAKEIADMRGDGGLIVVEHPLLFGSPLEHLVDKIILVSASTAIRLERLSGLGLSEAEAWGRADAQPSPESLAKKADVILENEGSLSDLEGRVIKLLEGITTETR